MINFILEIMGLIVEDLSQLCEGVKVFAFLIVFLLLVATLPVWILPFLIWKRHKEKDRNDEDDVYEWDEYTSATR